LYNSRQIYPKGQADPDKLSSTILIAFPLQQWLRERASTLRYSTLPVLFNVLANNM